MRWHGGKASIYAIGGSYLEKALPPIHSSPFQQFRRQTFRWDHASEAELCRLPGSAEVIRPLVVWYSSKEDKKNLRAKVGTLPFQNIYERGKKI